MAVALFAMLMSCGDASKPVETTVSETVVITTTDAPDEITTLPEETVAETTAAVSAETSETVIPLSESDLADYPKDSPEYELYRLFSQDIPSVAETAAETSVDEEGNVTETVTAYTRDGNAALYYKDIASGKTVVINGDGIFSSASMIKAVYCYTLLAAADAGEIDLDFETVYDTSMYVEGTGKFKNIESGSVFTVRELVSYVMRYSDNTAYSMLRKLFGTKYFAPAMEAAGISAVKYNKWWNSTAVQYGEFFTALALYFESDSENAAWLKEEMINSVYRAILPNALAPDIAAHKYGWDNDSYCDGGVLFGEGGTYVVVFMSDLDGGSDYRANTKFIYAAGDAILEMRSRDNAAASEAAQ